MSARARLYRTTAAVAALVLLGALFARFSVWQFRRAQESRTVAARFASGAEEPALSDAPPALSDDLRFRRLAIEGRYAPERQFLLDDRVHDGIAGYEVLTPLRLADGRSVLVNRGWIAANPDRRVLPDVGVDAQVREVLGRIERLPRAGLRLGASSPIASVAATAPTNAIVVVYPTAEELGALLGAPLADYEVLLDADQPAGFARDWRAPVLSPERHLGYAGQWLLFALGAVGAAAAIALKARSAGSPGRP